MKNPLTLLFAGRAVQAKLTDETSIEVFVRIMPQRHLGKILQAAEDQAALVDLCCYTKLEEGEPQSEFAPVGYAPVPMGWADNLTDESFEFIHAKAQELNFERAAKWGKAQIAAKKWIAPLHQAAIDQINPIIENLVEKMVERMERSSASTPKSPASPATPGSSS